MSMSPINLAVLVSGSGTTLANLIDQIASKQLHANIKLVLGSKRGIYGIERAINAGIPTQIDCCHECGHCISRVFPDFAMLNLSETDDRRAHPLCDAFDHANRAIAADPQHPAVSRIPVDEHRTGLQLGPQHLVGRDECAIHCRKGRDDGPRGA